MGAHKDLAGLSNGDLTVMRVSRRRVRNGRSIIMWQCRCVCGGEFETTTAGVRRGRSCDGCKRAKIAAARTSHGAACRGRLTPEYRSWRQMLRRCRRDSPHYRGRGITVCERWHRYENFLEDMGGKPTPKHSIDRIDNSKGYEPANCRWATHREQMRNTRSTVMLTHDGVTLCVAGWAERLGVSPKLLYGRIKDRMTVPDVLKPGRHRPGKHDLPRLPSTEQA